MRQVLHPRVTDHDLGIVALDDPGAGGANHLYRVSGFNTLTNASDPFVKRHGEPACYATILFQNGPIHTPSDANGVTHEALMLVVIDRLRSFQNGPFGCRENALALTKLEEALFWLEARTRARQLRNVEGTMTP